MIYLEKWSSLLWRHNGHDSVPNHQPHHCLLNCLFGQRSKKTSKLRVTGLCVGNSPGTGEFPAQKASNAENVSIWWRHHIILKRGHGSNNTVLTSLAFSQLLSKQSADITLQCVRSTYVHNDTYTVCLSDKVMLSRGGEWRCNVWFW